MRNCIPNFGTLVLTIGVVFIGFGQESFTAKQQEIINTIDQLSATTAPDGQGAHAYGSFLTENYSRWTLGSKKINYKQDWIEGIQEWFEDGWRVSDRKQQFIEIVTSEDVAYTRRIVTEIYLGPNKETSSSKSALTEKWVKHNDKWLLHRVDIQTMNN